MTLSRRTFVKLAGSGAAAGALMPLAALYSKAAAGMPSFGAGFGPLEARLAANAAELLVPQPNGSALDFRATPILALPQGFSYRVVSVVGQPMADGKLVPGDHDGMAAFQGPAASTILVRNHELSPTEVKFGNPAGVDVDPALKWGKAARGGTTTLIIDQRGHLVRDFGSLGGTWNNCAGGVTPWGSWLTCEETFSLSGPGSANEQKHGYVFEVPANAQGAVQAVALRAMGRFSHEATATDPDTGYVYETEDRSDSCFYRYKPARYGDLQAAGGELEAMVINGMPRVNTKAGFGSGISVGDSLPVSWVAIEAPDPATDTVRAEAQSKGGAIFYRGEGMWYGNGLIYFVSTGDGSAGSVHWGQVWAYDAKLQTVTLVVQSPGREVLDAPDNIVVGPDGRLYLYEDGGGDQYVVQVSEAGELAQVLKNVLNGNEFCGGCFSHDGRLMFVNIQSPGMTLVVEGPWRKGRS